MLIEQPPKLLRWLYPSALWRMNPNERAVYLTFDDGPIPNITPWVLDLLDKYGIKATFFLVGDNVRKHPKEFQMIQDRGHRVGNHTFNHIQGFKYLSYNYLANTNKADELIKSDLFRPPHGWMRWEQYYVLKHRYKIVMWDIVSRDYNRALSPQRCLDNVTKHLTAGSIVVFHDSEKAFKNMSYALPRTLKRVQEMGLKCKIIEL